MVQNIRLLYQTLAYLPQHLYNKHMPIHLITTDMPINNTLNITSNTTVVIPAGHYILDIIVQNTTVNAVTGGLKIGTTLGGVDVVVALTTGANSIQTIQDASLLKSVFSATVDTTLYIQAVTLWNSASINFYFVLRKFI